MAEVLRLVRMDAYAGRKPNELSGGQQQRVALARALAVQPRLPAAGRAAVSNLDAKLRHEMRSEIRRICKEAGFTTIYVTHDQKEALSVADRIAVMRAGRLAQVGTPGELYHRPGQQLRRGFHRQHQSAPRPRRRPRGPAPRRRNRRRTIARGMARPTAGDADATPAGGSDGRVIVSIRPEQMQIARNGAVDARPQPPGRPPDRDDLPRRGQRARAAGATTSA